MVNFDNLEATIVEALNSAITAGFLLIRGDWGVKWDEDRALWVWDPEESRVPGCDLLGALLLTQPTLDPALHRGDPDRAVRMLLDPSFYGESEPDLDSLLSTEPYVVCRNLANGWDCEDYLGDSEEAYLLGQRLADIYRPCSTDIINSTNSEIRLKIPMSLDSFPDVEDHAIPA